MRPVRAILIYFIAIFAGSAVIAPAVYFVVDSFAGSSQFCNYLISKGFHRFLTRSMMLIALIGLYPLYRALGIKTLAEAGLEPLRFNWRRLGYGFLFGFVTLSIPVFVSLASGGVWLNANKTVAEILRHLFNAGFSAVVVSLIEEIVFRGGILGSTQRIYGWRFGVIFSSAVYSIVHFFAKIDRLTEIHWYSGFAGILMMLRGFTDLKAVVPGFLNLFLAGVILGLFFKRTGNLYFSIGVHAGWIFWLKTYGFFSVFGENHNVWFFGSSKLIDGWITFIVLLPVTGAVLFLYRNPREGISEKSGLHHIDNQKDMNQ
jgi:membrane protease YdiL (CAAX protease family)